MDNEVFSHRDWDLLYPLVITRINSLISKYGLSREAIHFGNLSENNLPIITDSTLYEPLEKDLDEISKKFKQKIGVFVHKRFKNKKYYKKGKYEIEYNLGELVMYRKHVPSSMLDDTFEGPARIMELQSKGVTLRILKTNEKVFVSKSDLRKITLDEFVMLLPSKFDKDLKESLVNYRYRKYDQEGPEIEQKSSNDDIRKTRSGASYTVSLNMITTKPKDGLSKVIISNRFMKTKVNKKRPILKRRFENQEIGIPPVPDVELFWDETQLKEMSKETLNRIESGNIEKKVKSSFIKSDEKCVVKITLKPDNMHRKVKFSFLEVIYF